MDYGLLYCDTGLYLWTQYLFGMNILLASYHRNQVPPRKLHHEVWAPQNRRALTSDNVELPGIATGFGDSGAQEQHGRASTGR